MIARTYALAENAVVSMGDNRRNCSYCYFGGVADVLGISPEERVSQLPSLYENFIFDRCHPDDLSRRHAEEIAFLSYIASHSTPLHYRDYVLCNYLRVRDALPPTRTAVCCSASASIRWQPMKTEKQNSPIPEPEKCGY